MPLPTSGQATFQLLGDLTVHGVTKPVTWQVTAQFADTTVSGNATTSVNITDFGMTPPKAGPVLSIEDGLTLELAFTATRAAERHAADARQLRSARRSAGRELSRGAAAGAAGR